VKLLVFGPIDIFVTFENLKYQIISLRIIVQLSYHRKVRKYITKWNKTETLR